MSNIIRSTRRSIERVSYSKRAPRAIAHFVTVTVHQYGELQGDEGRREATVTFPHSWGVMVAKYLSLLTSSQRFVYSRCAAAPVLQVCRYVGGMPRRTADGWITSRLCWDDVVHAVCDGELTLLGRTKEDHEFYKGV